MLENENHQTIKLAKEVDEIRGISSPVKLKINKNQNDTKEETKQVYRDSDSDKHIEDEYNTKPPSEAQLEFVDTYSEILPTRFTPIRDEIRIDNIVEIALRSDKYNKSQLFELIKSMSEAKYENSKIISLDQMMVLRVLVVYDTFDLFSETINYYRKVTNINAKSEYVPHDTTKIKVYNEFETLEDTI